MAPANVPPRRNISAPRKQIVQLYLSRIRTAYGYIFGELLILFSTLSPIRYFSVHPKEEEGRKEGEKRSVTAKVSYKYSTL